MNRPLPQLLAEIDALLAKSTPGKWRVVKKLNLDARDRNVIDSLTFAICAGKRDGPHLNKGHFHPSEAEYFVDEFSVVETFYNQDYNTHEGGIPKETDAQLITALHNLYPQLREAAQDRERMREALDNLLRYLANNMENMREIEGRVKFYDGLKPLTDIGRAALARKEP